MGQDSAKASRKPRADSLRNREKLLVAAGEVFREGGPGASLEAVARRAGVGIGTLYRHFPTRDALFEAVYRRDVDLLADLAEQMIAAGADDPVGALRAWLHRGVEVIATKKGMLAALALATEGKQELFAYTSGRMNGGAGALIARAVAAGAMRDDVSSEDVLRALVGFSSMRDRPDWRQSVTRLVDIFIDGLTKRP